MSKYGHRNGNWLEAIVNKLGGEEEAERFLRNELVVVEKKATIPTLFFTLPTTDGTSGKSWITRLEKNSGLMIDDDIKSVLQSHYLRETTGVVNKIAIVSGPECNSDQRALSYAKECGWKRMNIESCCLAAELLHGIVGAIGFEYFLCIHEEIAGLNEMYHKMISIVNNNEFQEHGLMPVYSRTGRYIPAEEPHDPYKIGERLDTSDWYHGDNGDVGFIFSVPF